MRKFKILFVDDEREILEGIRRNLRRQEKEWDLYFAASGQAALGICAELDIDLLVTDAQMPQMNGKELIVALRQDPRTKDLPIIMLTGLSDDRIRREALENGVIEFLAKPILPAELILRLKNLLNLKRLNDELKELNEEKNRFLGIAAHDLRNPLNAAQTAIGLLKNKYGQQLGAGQQVILDLILRELRHMNNIVADFLDISTIEAGKLTLHRTPVQVDALLNERLKFYRELASDKEIVLEFDNHRVASQFIEIDPQKICQAIDNLVTNAVKYSYPESRILLTMNETNEELSISVRDFGPGIPADEQKLLFTPFGRTSVKTTAGERSTGLGLTIVKKIVAAHGGRIEVFSEIGKGSDFTFHLPKDIPPRD